MVQRTGMRKATQLENEYQLPYEVLGNDRNERLMDGWTTGGHAGWVLSYRTERGVVFP
jgi:hypothetical protein